MRKTLTLCLLLMAGMSFAQNIQSKKVLCIGNSFTYFFDSHEKLVEIAKSEGYEIKMRAVYEGGYTFNRHLHDLKTLASIESGNYDYAFIQDQSQMHARYASDTVRWSLAKDDTKMLAARIRMYSPNVNLYLEHTWAYTAGDFGGFGSLEKFDEMLDQGANMLASNIESGVSPIGKAFAIARQERPDINLYEPDDKHQSAYGTYLKSCVNYLIIFGKPFGDNTSACGLDAVICKYLRSLAERVVL